MKKVAVLVANGSEEIEFITPVDVLRRAEGICCDVFGVGGIELVGSHKIVLRADYDVKDLDMNLYDAIVIPGGMPGATNIANCKEVKEALIIAFNSNKVVGAICASPAVVLADNGFIDGRNATCFPAEDFIKIIKRAKYSAKDVEIDKNLVTANGPKSAMGFALALCKVLGVNPKI